MMSAVSEHPADDAEAPSEASAIRRGRATTKVSVMLIDDDPDIREILSEILSDAKYSVVTSSNGAHAMELLEQVTPSLILLDLNMPVMDGVEFRQRQRKDARLSSIPTVVMSAVHQMRERVADLDVDDALSKPVDLKDLLRIVGEYCQR